MTNIIVAVELAVIIALLVVVVDLALEDLSWLIALRSCRKSIGRDREEVEL
jgi:hypothetical protein